MLTSRRTDADKNMTKQSALTKEYFDKALKTLATKKDFGQTNRTLAGINKRLDGVEKTLDITVSTLGRNVALLTHVAGDVNTLKEDMGSLKATVESHTISLDKILKNSEHWRTEAAALTSAVRRHEV